MDCNHHNKKKEELSYLERFITSIPEAPKGKIVESEEPDFLITQGDETLGVEITKMFWNLKHNQRPIQATESVHVRIIDAVQKLFKCSKLPDCDVTVHFAGLELFKKDIDCIAKIIFEFVQANLPVSSGETNRFCQNNLENIDIPKEINSISIFRHDNFTKSSCSAPKVSFIPTYDPQTDLQPILNKKHPKAFQYRKKCNKLWLVIVFDLGNPSSRFDILENQLNHNFRSLFDKIYLFSELKQRAWLIYSEVGEDV